MENEVKTNRLSKKEIIALSICSCLLLCFFVFFGIKFHNRINLHAPVKGGLEDSSWSGDRLYLGSYEQDNQLDNGTEPVLWRVLAVKGKHVLLLSEYALDCVPFHEVSEDVTWADSTVRRWLNDEFYNSVFADRGAFRKDRILDTTCVTQENQVYGIDSGEDTVDKVFLFEWNDIYNEDYGFPPAAALDADNNPNLDQFLYAPVGRAAMCYPTLYTACRNPLITRTHDSRKLDNGEKIDGIGSVYWLLRTTGMTHKYIQYVSRWGRTTYDFLSPVDHTESCIRPAVWVDLSGLKLQKLQDGVFCVKEDDDYIKECQDGIDYAAAVIEALTDKPMIEADPLPPTRKTSIEDLENPVYGGNENGEWQGDRVYFGQYYAADKDETKDEEEPKEKAKEAVLWRVLQVDEKSIMLLSEFSLFKMRYDEECVSRWDTSSLRSYMNETLLEEMFDENERKLIKTTSVKNGEFKRYGTFSGEDTKDKIFLLSYDDCINEAYGFTKGNGENQDQAAESNSRVCYKKENKEVVSIYGKTDAYGNQIYSNPDNASRWYLRTAGFNEEFMSEVNAYGDAYRHELAKAKTKLWIRPVVVIDKTRATLIKGDDRFPAISIK